MSLFRPDILRLFQKVGLFTGGRDTVVPVTVIRGKSKNRHLPLDCVYVGSSPKTKAHWKHLVFSDVIEESADAVCLNRLRQFSKACSSECALLFVESETPAAALLRFEKQFVLPFFVNMSIDLTRFDEELTCKQRKSYNDSKRLIRKFQMSFDWSSTEEDRRDFYEHIYLPFIHKRHGEEALPVAYSDIFTDRFPHRLMRIKQADRVVAGGVVNFRNPQPSLAFFGVRDGLYEIARKGALGAVYYFVVAEMRREGFQKLFLGGSPAILTNGITRHKVKRLAAIDEDRPYNTADMVSCLLLRDTDGVRDFLEASPFIFVDDNSRLAAAVWSHPGKYRCREEFDKEVELALRVGLKECRVFEFEKRSVPDGWLSGFRADGKIVRQSAKRHYLGSPLLWRAA